MNLTDEDLKQLKKAVKKFNSDLKSLKEDVPSYFLPNEVDFDELQKYIISKKSLQETVDSLNKFKENAELVELPSGATLTAWEIEDLKKKQANAIEFLNYGISDEVKNFKNGRMNSTKYNEYQGKLEEVQRSIEGSSLSEISDLRNKLSKIGTPDYLDFKAGVYRENFWNAIKDFSDNNPEFSEIRKYLGRIRNDRKFFEETQKSGALQDFLTWYRLGNYGGYESLEDIAEQIELDLGIDD